MNNKRRILGIASAMLLALIGTVALVGSVQSARDEAAAREALVDVYVVDTFVPMGAESGTIVSSVSLELVPARLMQHGAVTDLAEVGANVAATDLHPGDQLLAARLVPRDEVSDDITDKVQVSALLSAERAVGGALRQGDLVGVYLSFDPFDLDGAGLDPEDPGVPETSEISQISGEPIAAAGSPAPQPTTPSSPGRSPNVTRLEFQHVLVTNVQTASTPVNRSSDDGAEIAQVTASQYVVTLALSPEQSERFVFAAEFGHVWLSIDPASVADDGTRQVTLGNVFEVVRP